MSCGVDEWKQCHLRIRFLTKIISGITYSPLPIEVVVQIDTVS
jgi:hypothetical protein